MEIWELIAREQIRDTLHRYNYFGDRAKLEEFAALFTEDGVLDSREGLRGTGRTEILAYMAKMTGKDKASGTSPAAPSPGSVSPVVRHHLSNIQFRSLTPERAEVISYFLRVQRGVPDHYGHYRDELVPVDGGWLIAYRMASVDA
jgi:hypothetical protein